MKHTPTIVVILFLGCNLQAQVDLDSLWSNWKNLDFPDSVRFKAMYQICNDRARSQPDSILKWTDQLLKQSQEKEDKKYEAGALLQRGRAFSYKGDYSKASTAYFQSLTLYEEVKYKFGIGRVLAYMAGNLANQGNYTAAIKTAERTMAIAQEIDNKKLSSGVAKVLGHSYNVLGNTIKAIEVFEMGRFESELVGDKETLAWHIHAIADVYSELGEEEKAEEYHRRSLTIYEEIDDKLGIAGIINHQATNSLKKRDFQSAIDEFGRSEHIYKLMGAKDAHTGTLLGLANVYKEIGDYTQAALYVDKAESIVNEMGYVDRKPELLIVKGHLVQFHGNHVKAIQWCQQALEIAEELGILRLQKEACNCLYISHKALLNSGKALFYHEQVLQLNDNLHSDEIGKKLQQVEFSNVMLADSLQQVEDKYELKLAHEAEVHRKNKTQNTLLGTGLILFLVAGGLWSRLRFTRKAKVAIEKERDKSDKLLLNILPFDVAQELKEKGRVTARNFEGVSILFTDFKSFTETSEKLSATELVNELNYCFEGFDRIMKGHGVEKIKTIGDAYMAAGGLQITSKESTKQTVKAALDMQIFIKNRKAERDKKEMPAFEMRAGIHTGPVVGGVVGSDKFQYDIWGDTVNTASRLESAGEISQVNISKSTYELIKDDPDFTFEDRGRIKVKGKGEIHMFLVRLRS